MHPIQSHGLVPVRYKNENYYRTIVGIGICGFGFGFGGGRVGARDLGREVGADLKEEGGRGGWDAERCWSSDWWGAARGREYDFPVVVIGLPLGPLVDVVESVVAEPKRQK